MPIVSIEKFFYSPKWKKRISEWHHRTAALAHFGYCFLFGRPEAILYAWRKPNRLPSKSDVALKPVSLLKVLQMFSFGCELNRRSFGRSDWQRFFGLATTPTPNHFEFARRGQFMVNAKHTKNKWISAFALSSVAVSAVKLFWCVPRISDLMPFAFGQFVCRKSIRSCCALHVRCVSLWCRNAHKMSIHRHLHWMRRSARTRKTHHKMNIKCSRVWHAFDGTTTMMASAAMQYRESNLFSLFPCSTQLINTITRRIRGKSCTTKWTNRKQLKQIRIASHFGNPFRVCVCVARYAARVCNT